MMVNLTTSIFKELENKKIKKDEIRKVGSGLSTPTNFEAFSQNMILDTKAATGVLIPNKIEPS